MNNINVSNTSLNYSYLVGHLLFLSIPSSKIHGQSAEKYYVSQLIRPTSTLKTITPPNKFKLQERNIDMDYKVKHAFDGLNLCSIQNRSNP